MIGNMIHKLTSDLAAAVDANSTPLKVVHPETNRVYVVIDDETYQRTLKAISSREKQADCNAIAQGILELEAGDNGSSVTESRQRSIDRLRSQA